MVQMENLNQMMLSSSQKPANAKSFMYWGKYILNQQGDKDQALYYMFTG